MKTLAACLLSLSLVLPSCASTSASDYFVNRGGDLVDVLRLNLLVGAGAVAKVEYTRALHFGIGYTHDVWAFGLANREVGRWRETAFTWGLILGHHDERSVTGIDGNRLTGSYGWRFGEKGGNAFELSDQDNFLDFLGFRWTVMIGLGLNAEFRLGEFIDFVGGIFQFDPSGDDRQYSGMKTAE